MDVERPEDLDGVERAWVSDAIAEGIRELGFRYVPLTPGSSFRGLHDSIVNFLGNSDPQVILCLHEEVAISVAHGYAKATGTACPAIIHDLVGLMNGSMAVYNAFCDQTPVIIIGGGGPYDRGLLRPIDAVHSAETQSEIVREYTKWTDDPKTLLGTVAGLYRAHQFSMSVPTGPTYLTIDVDLQEEPIPEDYIAPELAEFTPHPPLAADPARVEQAAQLLAAAKLPVIVAGGQLALNEASTPVLVELAEVLGAAYYDGGGMAFPTRHPHNVSLDRSVLEVADVLLIADVTDIPPLLGGGLGVVGKTGDRTLIEISCGDLHLKSWSNAFSTTYRRDVLLLSDPLVGLQAILEATRRLVSPERVDERAKVVRARAQATFDRLEQRRTERFANPVISPERFTSELWDAVKETNWMLTRTSSRLFANGIFEFDHGGRHMGSGGGGGLGYGPGAAVGAALAAHDRGQIAVAVIGDGDFIMAPAALWTAVHYRLPLLMVIADNHSFGNDEEHQQRIARVRNRPGKNSWIGVHIDDPALDYATIARGMGCHGEGPISDPDDIAPALAAAVKAVLSGEVALVHVECALPGNR